MVSLSAVLGVAVVAVGLVITPGPDTVYLVSRSLGQGRRAGTLPLAWGVLRPVGRAVFGAEATTDARSPRRLFLMGGGFAIHLAASPQRP